jgi:hypothetical protein
MMLDKLSIFANNIFGLKSLHYNMRTNKREQA